MPMMMCAVDREVATKLGYAFNFKKNVPQFVPPRAVAAVMEAGAFPAEGEETAVAAATAVELTAKQLEPSDPEVRQARIVESIVKLRDAGELMFTAGGKPNPVQISKDVGFRIDAMERDAAWAVCKDDATAS